MPSTAKAVLKIAGVAAVIIGALLAFDHLLSAKDAEWEARVERVQESARADSAAAAAHRARADSLQDVVNARDSVIARRDTIIRIIEAEIDSLPPEPAGCRIFTEPRDRLISECQLQVADVKQSLQDSREAVDELRRAEARATKRADDLSATLDARPKPRPAWAPSVALGPFAGFCIDGRACAGVGIQVSWRVSLF